MNIAVFHELPNGGARRAVIEFSRELKKKSKVDLYYIDEKKESGLEKAFSEVSFIKFIPQIWTGNNWKAKIYKDTTELFRIYMKHKEIAQVIDAKGYDFVFVHGSRYTQAPFILRLLKTKKVYYCQEPLRMVYEELFNIPRDLTIGKKYYERINRNNRRLIDKYNASKADIILANSKFTQRNIKKYMGLNSTVSYMGIDPHFFSPQKIKKKFDILFMGSKDDIDGYQLLIESIKLMSIKPNVRWLLRENEWVSDEQVKKIYNESRILVCLAYKEPFGLSPIEAQACGTVVAAVAEGGYLETINDGVSGVFVKRNTLEIANVLSRLLKNPIKLSHLSEKGTKNVYEKWTWEIATENLIKNVRLALD